ncbi:MAG: DUF3108 domain-containing protein [Thermodesulfovibrionales bacterium]|nr:DUF3108 domain-containing protein [Thermodesulfovibrionales bacterium]
MSIITRHKILILAVLTSIVMHCVAIYAFVKSDLLNLNKLINTTIIAKLIPQNIEKITTKHINEKPSDTDSQTLEKNPANESILETQDTKTSLPILDNQIPSTNEEQKIRLEVPRLNDAITNGHSRYTLKIDADKSYHKPSDNAVALLRYNKEELYYNIYWVGIHVGNAKLSAKRQLTDMVIQSEVHSNKFISNFYRVEDYAKSIIVNGKPHKFRIKQIEGKYRSDKETIFDYSEGQITFIDYLKNKQMDHNVKGTLYWDVISGFYYLRSMPVFDTSKIYVDVFDSNKFIRVQVIILGREKVETINGEDVDTIKTKIILHTDGLFKKVGDIFVWLTDDANRLPIKVETKVPVGKVTAELSKIETE